MVQVKQHAQARAYVLFNERQIGCKTKLLKPQFETQSVRSIEYNINCLISSLICEEILPQHHQETSQYPILRTRDHHLLLSHMRLKIIKTHQKSGYWVTFRQKQYALCYALKMYKESYCLNWQIWHNSIIKIHSYNLLLRNFESCHGQLNSYLGHLRM